MKKFSKGNHYNLYQNYSPPRNYQNQYNNDSHNDQQHLNRQFRYISYILLLLALLVYYFYLSSLYLIDLTLEGDTLREPIISDQSTIRVAIPKSTSSTLSPSSSLPPLPEIISLKKFVSHYSLCPCVREIQVRLLLLLSYLFMFIINNQIVWPYDPYLNDFEYAHTHSRVTFETNSNEDLHVETDSVTLLDIDVFVSCSGMIVIIL